MLKENAILERFCACASEITAEPGANLSLDQKL